MELADLFVEIMDCSGTDTVSFVIGDIIPILNYRSVRAERSDVRRVLQTFWHLKPATNTLTYQQYSLGISPQKYCSKTVTGRYYTVNKDFLISLSLI